MTLSSNLEPSSVMAPVFYLRLCNTRVSTRDLDVLFLCHSTKGKSFPHAIFSQKSPVLVRMLTSVFKNNLLCTLRRRESSGKPITEQQ
jgi:hypothetical protein